MQSAWRRGGGGGGRRGRRGGGGFLALLLEAADEVRDGLARPFVGQWPTDINIIVILFIRGTLTSRCNGTQGGLTGCVSVMASTRFQLELVVRSVVLETVLTVPDSINDENKNTKLVVLLHPWSWLGGRKDD